MKGNYSSASSPGGWPRSDLLGEGWLIAPASGLFGPLTINEDWREAAARQIVPRESFVPRENFADMRRTRRTDAGTSVGMRCPPVDPPRHECEGMTPG